MEEEIFKKLEENIQDWSITEDEISMVELAIYQKSIEQLKNQKIIELEQYFEQQAKIYNQKSFKYQDEIEKNIIQYKKQMEKLINIYDQVYMCAFRTMQNAINNQKIAVANIVTVTDKIETEEISEEEKAILENTRIAIAQKKLNYAVIIEECRARIEWCIENVSKDINNIFTNHINQLQVYKENIFVRIRRTIFYKFSGRKKYKKILENYEKNVLKEISNHNTVKIFELASILKGITKQMKIANIQVANMYEKMIKV